MRFLLIADNRAGQVAPSRRQLSRFNETYTTVAGWSHAVEADAIPTKCRTGPEATGVRCGAALIATNC
jgi:hypothetical protein